ncbi:MAG: glycosyltransferase family 4 protein [Planctomycetaceae bacterium]|nr:glycosyltransferase family 4 protein [Planctomycetaceae bacterium]
MKKDRKRVLMVGGFPPEKSHIYGGIVTSCRALKNSSIADSFEVEYVDSTQISNPPPSLPRRLLLSIQRFAIYLSRLLIFRPHAVVLFASKGASLLEKGAMAWCAKMFGIKSLIFPRNGSVMTTYRKSSLQRILFYCALKGANTFLCQGPAWKKFAVDDLGFSEERAVVVLNWTATPELIQSGTERFFRNVDRCNSCLFVGWLEQSKGVLDLLDACGLLKYSHQFHLTIAGRGHTEVEAKRRVVALGLSEHVSFVGWVEGDALRKLYSEHNIFILPSWAEGFPNSIIEAMASGLAVIGTAVGNIPDIVKHDVDALLVQPRDVDGLSNAMKLLFENPSRRYEIARCGHSLARRDFSLEPAVRTISAAIAATIGCVKNWD